MADHAIGELAAVIGTRAISVAVAFTLPLGAALVPLSAQVLGHLELHQRLRHHSHTLAKRIYVRLSVGLAQQLRECHAQVSAIVWFSLSAA
jgi:hypothetical protein